MKDIQTTSFNVIYILSKGDIDGALKIGKTDTPAPNASMLPPNCEQMNNAVIERLKGIATYGVTDLKILHTEVAWYKGSNGEDIRFDDKEVHDVLLCSGYKRHQIESYIADAKEWFEVDLETAKKAITAVKEEREKIDGPVVTKKKIDIFFREEQNRAISQSITHYAAGEKMLWNAKMRFGKTLCALELIRQMRFKRTLILTHRPTVRSGWFKDYHLIKFDNYEYGSKLGDKNNPLDDEDKKGKDFDTLQQHLNKGECNGYIYFASMQDLRGSRNVSNKGIDKNNEVFNNDWDFIILDEAHEGTQTLLGKSVINELTKDKNPKLLYLSGTPYNILSQFDEEEVFTWDYVMEQAAKERWPIDHPDERNPYEGLAKMNIYTYSLGDVFTTNSYFQSDEDYFNFAEFFRVWTGDSEKDGASMPDGAKEGDFVHADDIRRFLDLLCEESAESNYPFSCDKFRTALSHTLWMLPGVAQAQAMAKMIESHPLHTDMGFYVVNVAGDGNKIASTDPDDIIIEKYASEALSKVELAIRGDEKKKINPHNRTITLSCGRLTTGVSVPEWTGVFMLSGGYSTGAANYMQTIFRCQTPFKNGAIKTNCYAFDFAPDRTLTVIDDWVELRPGKDVQSRGNSVDHTEKVKRTLQFCPVIAMKGGQEIEYDALSFVTQVNNAYSEYLIQHGYKGRKLVKDFASFKDDDYKLLEQIGKLFGGGKVQTNANGEIVVAKSGLTGQEWTCTSCGATKQTGEFCEKCGAPRPPIKLPSGTWTCKACGHKGNQGSTCDKCGTPRKEKQPGGGWTCLNCGHNGNHGSTCDECGTAKPLTKKQESDRRTKAQNVLNQIFVRLPLLLFGAVEDASSLTIEELTNVIDDESWKEFMPDNFTKAMMKQIEHLIRIDRLVAVASQTIEQAKKADELPIEQRIITIAQMTSRFHFPDKETVLTPWRVVNMHMADTLGGYDFFDENHEELVNELRLVEQGNITTDVFCDKDTRILEINSKSGVYPLWLACTLWKLLGTTGMTHAEEWELWKTVLENNLFVVCKTRMAEKITRRVLAGYRNDIQVNTVSYENIIDRIKTDQENLIQEIKNPATYNNPIIKDMLQFKAIVGNPPYQVMDGGTDRGALPVYQHFVSIAEKINPSFISMIMPARWYAGGRGLDDFRLHMLNNRHLRYLFDFESSKCLFANADIAGGICYFLWQNSYEGKCLVANMSQTKEDAISRDLNEFKIFIRSNKAIPILNKVRKKTSSFLNSQVLSINPFGFRTYFRGNNKKNEDDVRILTSKGWSYVQRNEIVKGLEYLDKYKIIIGRFVPSNGELNVKPGEGYRVLTMPKILLPFEINTETYIDAAVFNTEEEAENYCAFLCTKFARFMLRLSISSVNVTRECFAFVPQQDFTQKWTDEKLYAKYGLSKDEIDYIESLIKPMG